MSAGERLLDRRYAMLLVIDVQERINTVMADQDHIPRIAVLVKACKVLEVPVVATEQYPKGLGSTVHGLAECLLETPVSKDSFSCAREPVVRSALEAAGRNQVVVTGIEAHVCVLQTAIDLARAGYEVHVPHDAVNSRRTADRKWALSRMEASGAVITATESVLFELLERCDTAEFKKIAAMIKEIPV
jgi:nicotinamidase-related amidase